MNDASGRDFRCDDLVDLDADSGEKLADEPNAAPAFDRMIGKCYST